MTTIKEQFLRGFRVQFLGATNCRGSRVKITDMHNRNSKTIAFDYAYNNSWEVARDWLECHGIKIECRTADKDNDYLLTKNFDIMINIAKFEGI